MAKVARLADYRAKNSTHNLEDWQAAFKEYLESEERSDNTISSYISDLKSFIKWFEKTQGSSFHPRLEQHLTYVTTSASLPRNINPQV
jgi:site-specific recombinase XerD